MRRFIALLLAASLSLQAAGCTVTMPSHSTRAGIEDTPYAPLRRNIEVATPNSGVNRANAPEPIAPPTIPDRDFWNGPSGIIVGVGVIGALALALIVAGRGSNSTAGSAAPAVGPAPGM